MTHAAMGHGLLLLQKFLLNHGDRSPSEPLEGCGHSNLFEPSKRKVMAIEICWSHKNRGLTYVWLSHQRYSS